MITLMTLAALIILVTMILCTVGVGVALVFGDVIVAGLIIYWICKLCTKKKESKK